jgi:hypothetical protein
MTEQTIVEQFVRDIFLRLPLAREAIEARTTVRPMEGRPGFLLATVDCTDLFDGDKAKTLKAWIPLSAVGESTDTAKDRMVEWAFHLFMMGKDHSAFRPEYSWLLELPDRLEASAG